MFHKVKVLVTGSRGQLVTSIATNCWIPFLPPASCLCEDPQTFSSNLLLTAPLITFYKRFFLKPVVTSTVYSAVGNVCFAVDY